MVQEKRGFSMAKELEFWPGIVCYGCGVKPLSKLHIHFDTRELYSYVSLNGSNKKRLLCASCKEEFLHLMLKYPELQLAVKVEPYLKHEG